MGRALPADGETNGLDRRRAAALPVGHGDVLRSLGFALVDDFVRGFFEGFMIAQDPNNLLIQARKARFADPSQGGDMAAALARITAKAFVYAFTGDVMFPPEDCRLDAARIPVRDFASSRPRQDTSPRSGCFPRTSARSTTPFAKYLRADQRDRPPEGIHAAHSRPLRVPHRAAPHRPTQRAPHWELGRRWSSGRAMVDRPDAGICC